MEGRFVGLVATQGVFGRVWNVQYVVLTSDPVFFVTWWCWMHLHYLPGTIGVATLNAAARIGWGKLGCGGVDTVHLGVSWPRGRDSPDGMVPVLPTETRLADNSGF